MILHCDLHICVATALIYVLSFTYSCMAKVQEHKESTKDNVQGLVSPSPSEGPKYISLLQYPEDWLLNVIYY